jgi:hypothetical protein
MWIHVNIYFEISQYRVSLLTSSRYRLNPCVVHTRKIGISTTLQNIYPIFFFFSSKISGGYSNLVHHVPHSWEIWKQLVAFKCNCCHLDGLPCHRVDGLPYWHVDGLPWCHLNGLPCRHLDRLLCRHMASDPWWAPNLSIETCRVKSQICIIIPLFWTGMYLSRENYYTIECYNES